MEFQTHCINLGMAVLPREWIPVFQNAISSSPVVSMVDIVLWELTNTLPHYAFHFRKKKEAIHLFIYQNGLGAHYYLDQKILYSEIFT